MTLKTYDPKQVAIIIGVHVAGGFVDGTFVTVKRDEAKYSKRVGADGEVSRSRSNNMCATVELTVKATSATNDYLSAQALLDDLSNGGVVEFMLKDNSGRTLVASAECWIQEEPTDEFGKEEGDRTWILALGQTTKFTGGN